MAGFQGKVTVCLLNAFVLRTQQVLWPLRATWCLAQLQNLFSLFSISKLINSSHPMLRKHYVLSYLMTSLFDARILVNMKENEQASFQTSFFVTMIGKRILNFQPNQQRIEIRFVNDPLHISLCVSRNFIVNVYQVKFVYHCKY